jgi:hypothetical protein
MWKCSWIQFGKYLPLSTKVEDAHGICPSDARFGAYVQEGVQQCGFSSWKEETT